MHKEQFKTIGDKVLYPLFQGWGLSLIALFLTAASAYPQTTFDSALGVDQSLTVGYSGRTFSETFHNQETYGLPVESQETDAWKMVKSFKFSSLYDGNVLNSLHDPKNDFIYTYAAPFLITRRGTSGMLSLFYDIAYIQYVENEKMSDTNHNMGLSTKYKIGKLTLTVGESFSPDKSVAVGERTELGDSASRVTTISNGANAQLDWAFSSKTNLSLSYGHSLFYLPLDENSVEVTNFSTQTHNVKTTLSYLWKPKTKVFVGYQWSLIDYYVGTGDFDSVTQTVNVGVAGKLTPKMGYTLDIGVLNREYRHLEVDVDPGLIVKMGLNRKLTEKISATVSATVDTSSENLDPDKTESMSVANHFYGMNLTWRARPRFTVSMNGGIGYVFRDGYISLADDENPLQTYSRENNDDYYEYDVLLSWAPRPYVSMTLGYYFRNKNSTFKSAESDNKRFLGTVDCKF